MLLNRAFTLSEILIAMTVIGVIAAVTVPTLMTDTSSTANRTKFKSTFVQFQTGLTHAENVQKHSFVDVGEKGTNNAKYSLDEFMGHHFNSRRIARSEDPAGMTYVLKSGAHIIFPQAAQTTMTATGCTNNNPCMIYIDVNGKTGPNEIVLCTSGATSPSLDVACTVDESVVSDIFPIRVQKSQIYPQTNAVNYVLNH